MRPLKKNCHPAIHALRFLGAMAKPTLKLVTVACDSACDVCALRTGWEFSITNASPWSGNDSDIKLCASERRNRPRGNYSRLPRIRYQ